ncbi:MAG TPA: DNA translocase FtsK 4TM domain-containing protein [Oscillospiraceae bacterium]|nr:DNA translocase FtsK 4TM domain-containing protein [Oscillospiraceae bacterium]
MAIHDIRDEIRQQVKAVLIIALAAFAFAALLFPRQTGEVGMFFNNVLRMLTGDLSIYVPVVLVINNLLKIFPWQVPNLKQRTAGIVLFFIILLVYAHLQVMAAEINLVMDLGIFNASLRLGLQQQGGGVLGAILAVILYFLFKDLGSRIILLALAVIAFILVTNISLSQLLQTASRCLLFVGRSILQALKAVAGFFRFIFAQAPTEGLEVEDVELEEFPALLKKKRQQSPAKAGDEAAPLSTNNQSEVAATVTPSVMESIQATLIPDTPEMTEAIGAAQQLELFAAGDKPLTISIDSVHGAYHLPPLKLLPKLPKHKDPQSQKNLVERAKVLERTLDSFGVKAHVTDAQCGPTVTRFELQPEVGVKVSKIVSLADDIALNLAAADVRIEAPIPGKAAIGIEVPNKVIAPVYLREVLEDEKFQNATSVLTIALGKDITGNSIVTDLMKMPHLLIAGSTGSGKSVCINVLIASILFNARPDEVKFVMIDPKVVELSTFNGIPHLLMPVVTDAKRASLALKNMIKEMTRRYELFARESVRDINTFNNKKRQQNEETELLPYVVVIIDELADLMMVAAADVEDSIARLAQMSRAAGIHLVIATQRPSVDVITGVIKANITSRIAFAVSSQADSRTILDMGGAEKLLGRGDALFHPIGLPKPFRIQGAFINERELNNLLEFIKKQGEPDFDEQLLPEEEADEFFYEEDELFPDAVMLFAEAGTASISLLQRRLRIGYTRAARLVDDMESRGFIGRFEGSKAREVLVTPEQVRKLLFERDQS